jgi:hypothetical protein
MLTTNSAQANAAKKFLRFTAEYLQLGIFLYLEINRIVAASGTPSKVTKVTPSHCCKATVHFQHFG